MRKRGTKSKRPKKEEFFKIYDNENLTVEQIAKMYEVSTSTIYNWATQLRKENLSDKQIYNRLIVTQKKVKRKETG